MPIHGRLISQGMSRIGPIVSIGSKYVQKENKIWKSLYPDKHKRRIVRGSLALGSGLETFRSDDGVDDTDGTVFKPNASNPFTKARGGRARRTGRRYSKSKFHCRCRRQSSKYGKSRSSRNRFYR